jgi:small-conductance mechanosensitive channel
MNQRNKRALLAIRDISWLAVLAVAGVAIAAQIVVAQSTAPQTTPRPLPSLTGGAILAHLDAVIGWYRDLATKSPDTGQPSDEIYWTSAQTLAAEAARLAFQSAEAEAVVISEQTKKTTAGQPAAGGPQNYSQMKARVAGTVADAESQIEDLNRQIARSQGAKRESLIAKREALQGELELDRAVQQSVEKLSSFEGAGESTSDLLANINQLKSSLPEVFGTAKPASVPVSPQRQASPNTNTGLFEQAVELYRQIRAMHTLDQLSTQAWHVREAAEAVRLPLRQAISATVQNGRDLANQSASNATQIESIHKQFQQIIGQFNQLAQAAVPLAQEVVVLDQARADLSQWRAAIGGEFGAVLAALLIRAAAIAIALVLVFIVSEAWRRFTFRYVRDVRRRRQFLIVRRFVVGFLFALILILGFVSEFSSLATFAGFMTAGIAVSLQAVLLSIAAYFFLVGRYGISVGDRISVSGVVGDVVDIGLVRLYLMELAGTGVDFYPTGRIVVFSNSVLFQATTPLYKQIPGTEFVWHEVAVTLAPTGNYKLVQEKILAAVNAVWAKYREDLERQHRAVYQQIDFPLSAPEPKPTLQFAPAGLELQVRYPVNIRYASEVDDQLTRKLLDVVSSDEQLRASVTGSPQIRSAVRG